MTKKEAQEFFGKIGEYNSDPRKVLLKKKKRLKLKKKAKIFLFLLVITLITLYFISDLSKIRSISVEGNQLISSQYIQEVLDQYKQEHIFFLNTSQVEKNVLKMPLVKSATVSKNLFGQLKVHVSEGDILAYATVKNKTYIIDSMGHVFENKQDMELGDIKKYVKISYFTSYDQLKKFAKEYVKIPESVHTSVSDIILSNSKTESFRVRMIMDNGKILVVRVNEMVDVFQRFDYQANNIVQKDVQTYVFMNGKLYMYPSDDKFDYKR